MLGLERLLVRRGNSARLVNVEDDNDAECDGVGGDDDERDLHVWASRRLRNEGEFAQVGEC